MTEQVTINPADLAAMIAQGVAAALEANKKTKKAKGSKEKTPRKLLTEEQKSENRAKTDAVTIANFTAKGYKDVTPRVNTMTYNRWIENGRRVKKGEKSTKCGSFALFHVSQTEAIKENTVH